MKKDRNKPEVPEGQGTTSSKTPSHSAVKAEAFRQEYGESKERDIQSLEREIEEKNSRDTKKKRRSFWIKTVLMLLLIGGSIAIMFTMNSYLSDAGTKSFKDMVRGIDLPWFLILLGIILLFMLMESLKYAYLLKIQTGHFHFRIAIKTMFLGKYYDGITPLGTGGQPFQIYYLHKKKIPAGVATSIPLVRYIISTFAFCTTAVVLLVFTHMLRLLNGVDGTIILVIASISLAFNFLVPVIIIFVSIFPRAGKKMIIGIVGLLSKIRLVKHKYPTMKKYVYEVEEYRKSLRATFGSWWKPLPLILLCYLEVVLYVALPFCAVLAIAGPGVTSSLPHLFFEIACLTMVSFYSASLVPTPGNSVAVEGMTTLVFLTVSGVGNVIGWVVLTWRFANYYIYILSGIGINIFEVIRSVIRNRRLLRGGSNDPPPENPTQSEQIEGTETENPTPFIQNDRIESPEEPAPINKEITENLLTENTQASVPTETIADANMAKETSADTSTTAETSADTNVSTLSGADTSTAAETSADTNVSTLTNADMNVATETEPNSDDPPTDGAKPIS